MSCIKQSNAATIAQAVACLLAISCSSVASAEDGIEKARLGRVMWSAFQCSIFGELSDNKKEQARLFQIGLKAGRDFLEALNANQITQEAMNTEVPVAVIMMLQGPSIEFIVGRIYEAALSDAYDEIVKRRNGMTLPISDWVHDEGVKKIKANTKFLANNCLLIH